MGKVSGGCACTCWANGEREASLGGRLGCKHVPLECTPVCRGRSLESGGLQTTWQPPEARGLQWPKTWFAAPSRGSRPWARGCSARTCWAPDPRGEDAWHAPVTGPNAPISCIAEPAWRPRCTEFHLHLFCS